MNILRHIDKNDPIVSAWSNFKPEDEPFARFNIWIDHYLKETQTEHKCNCSIQILMRTGCQCGGK